MMKTERLSTMAVIDISNVDKKSKDGEKPVRLCNFVDVYHNWAITKNMYNGLMSATANDNQIAHFSIKKGQVAITKDSETRDDIGIPAYMADDFDDVVLGYHCALITPKDRVLCGAYLNVVLHSPYAGKYFEANASGSGQRYTLTNEIIGNFPVPMIPFEEQERIAAVFEHIDRKIEINNATISELESMAKDIYDYWFVQFDFPDENGKPYKSNGGKMVWNEELKREIPEGWETKRIIDVADVYQPKTISENDLIPDGKYYVYGANGIVGKYDKYNHLQNEIAVCCRGAGCGHFLMTQPRAWITGNAMVLSPRPEIVSKEYLYYSLSVASISKYITGSAQPQITRSNISPMKVLIPDSHLLKQFDNISSIVRLKMQKAFSENQELTSLRDWILPMLMNGQVKVGQKEFVYEQTPSYMMAASKDETLNRI